jgi:hypothetical protein
LGWNGTGDSALVVRLWYYAGALSLRAWDAKPWPVIRSAKLGDWENVESVYEEYHFVPFCTIFWGERPETTSAQIASAQGIPIAEWVRIRSAGASPSRQWVRLLHPQMAAASSAGASPSRHWGDDCCESRAQRELRPPGPGIPTGKTWLWQCADRGRSVPLTFTAKGTAANNQNELPPGRIVRLKHRKPKALHRKPKALHRKPKALHRKPKALHRKPKALHRKPKALPLGLYVVAFQAERQNTRKTASICGPFTPVYKC